ncbi:MAG: F0F1 ATP synthase subunit B [Alcanivorax sp.]|uniref:ATP synthase subunit b n=1 Tax=Alloalcanivorax marinus TaxID=1177169 RepID=A0A9Q3YMD0_9GAMM|nr:F0F1 ATP synthase subunit B [Alloalcanivorax marinus]MBM7332171.1 F0F1 ATP synthase subunit B [Alloalcanivorax marinus]MCC4307426.1 F0F1 ATP synthase subunit B [Alloalcanivorax marinus]MCH2556500.1 F0F1 ATP synthase subunit B [Alcanivorax sp.]MCU5786805.1 ATP synthase F0 subunit B [Alloalcanivorax marinus]
MNINATLIGQAIWFALFVFFCMKFVWPPISRALDERKQKIAEGLSAADRAERDLELAQEKASANLKDAKDKASEIIEQANRRANQIVEEAKDQARTEGERLIAKAQSEIDQEINRAREELRKEVSALALSGAEKVLAREVNRDSHKQLLDELAAQL